MDFSKIIWLCFYISLLAACGGGGSEESPSIPEVITPPDYSKVDVEINIDSASVIVPYTMAMAESTLQIVDLFVSELRIQQISDETSIVSLPCTRGGTADFVWQDKDNSKGLSMSDTLDLTFENCDSSSLDAWISGSSSLIVEEKGLNSIGFSVQINATISDSGTDIPVSGAMNFIYNKTEINESLEISSNQQNFTFVIEGFKEKLGSFELTKRVENNFHYSIDYEY
ncbi:MAG: hypothetical protein OQK03_02165, partial [Colwellia sp.]|nr:hypothetical protein [Colwellia sp.]